MEKLDEKGFDFESKNLGTNFLANLYARKRPIDTLILNQEIKNFNRLNEIAIELGNCDEKLLTPDMLK